MELNPEAHIQKMLQRTTPYVVNIFGTEITITSDQVYPPGQLTEFFLEYLLNNVGIQGTTIVDLGAACSPLGVVLAKNGAESVISVDINTECIDCSKSNIEKHNLQNTVSAIEGNGCSSIIEMYKHKCDLVIAGVPWSSMSQDQFNAVDDKGKGLYRAFFDIEDKLITDILTDGFNLLKPDAKYIYITSSKYAMERMDSLFLKHNVHYEIVASEDIHNDGNDHYILRLSSNSDDLTEILGRNEEL